MEKLEAAIEAILFSAGDSVETGRIAKAIGQDKTTTEKIIRNMMLKYNARDRGIKILELDGAFQLCTKQEYYEYLVEIALQPKKAVHRMADASRCVYRAESMPKEVLDYQPPVDIRELIGDLTLAKLQNIFNSIIKRQENKVDPIRSKFGKIEKEEVSLEDKMSDLELYAGTHHYFSFRGLLERQSGKIQVIVTFLAILELMKTGVITIEQEHLFDDIQITSLIYEEQQADGETGSSD